MPYDDPFVEIFEDRSLLQGVNRLGEINYQQIGADVEQGHKVASHLEEHRCGGKQAEQVSQRVFVFGLEKEQVSGIGGIPFGVKPGVRSGVLIQRVQPLIELTEAHILLSY